jgi:hypothetical protein
MRLSDADREALFAQLSSHAAAGRLDLAELERRVGVVAAAVSREDAAPAVADLPPLPAAGTGDVAGRRRGHAEAARAAPDWQPTGERFRDPRSQRIMRVWVDGAGARHYVPEDG